MHQAVQPASMADALSVALDGSALDLKTRFTPGLVATAMMGLVTRGMEIVQKILFNSDGPRAGHDTRRHTANPFTLKT